MKPKFISNIYFQLFFSFFKIGTFTFGGGWAMIAIIEKEVVDKYQWIKREDFLDLLAISQALPGVLAVNIAVAVGDKLRGTKGSIWAALGTIIPSFAIILFIAVFLTPDMIKNNEIVNRIFMGIRPAVVALIVAPVVSSAKAAKINMKTIIIPIAIAFLIYSGIPYLSNPILYIVLGVVGGYILYIRKRMNKIKSNKEEVGS